MLMSTFVMPSAILFVSFLAAAYAQGGPDWVPTGLMLAVSVPTADGECLAREADDEAIWVHAKVNYTEGCFNFDELPAQTGFRAGQHTCWWGSPNCPNDWEAHIPDDYDPQNNYSRVWFSTSDPVWGPDQTRFQDFEAEDAAIRLFEGRDCTDVSEERPYHQWGNCASEETRGDCVDLPFSIGGGSFQLLRIPEQNRSQGCLIAAVRGAGERSSIGFLQVLIIAGTVALTLGVV